MEEVKEIITSFRKKRDWSKYDSESNLAKSIIIEAAELLEHFQWDESGDNMQEIKDELADGDKIPDPIDECPNIPEDYNGIQDSDGCPEPPSQCLGENCTLVSPNCNKCPCQYADFSNTLHPNDKVRARLRDLPTKKHYNFSNFAPLTSFILP